MPVIDFPSNLEHHRFITLTSNFDKSGFYQWLLQYIPANRSEVVADGLMSAFGLCREGLGITILPEYLVERESCLTQIKCNDPLPVNDLWLLSHKDLRNSATVKALKNFLAKELQPVFRH